MTVGSIYRPNHTKLKINNKYKNGVSPAQSKTEMGSAIYFQILIVFNDEFLLDI